LAEIPFSLVKFILFFHGVMHVSSKASSITDCCWVRIFGLENQRLKNRASLRCVQGRVRKHSIIRSSFIFVLYLNSWTTPEFVSGMWDSWELKLIAAEAASPATEQLAWRAGHSPWRVQQSSNNCFVVLPLFVPTLPCSKVRFCSTHVLSSHTVPFLFSINSVYTYMQGFLSLPPSLVYACMNIQALGAAMSSVELMHQAKGWNFTPFFF
jgi:hypothetical protein